MLAGQPIVTDEKEYFKETGVSLYNLGRYDEAIINFNLALHNNKDAHTCALIQNYVGMAKRALERNREAIDYFTESIVIAKRALETNKGIDGTNHMKLNRTLGLAYHNLGYTHGLNSEYKAAILNFKEAEKYFETSGDTLNRIYTLRNEGYAHAMLDERDQAIKCLDFERPEHQQFGYVQSTKGLIHMWFDNFKKALECFEQATEVNPELALAWRNKGYALYRSEVEISCDQEDGRFRKPIKCFDKAIELDRHDPFAWHYRGYVHFSSKQYDLMKECFGKAIGIRPSLPDSWWGKGIALYLLSRYDEAIECFDEAIRLFESPVDKEHKSDKAVKQRKIADARYKKGLSLASLERHDKAIECFNEAQDDYKKALGIDSGKPFYKTSIEDIKETSVEGIKDISTEKLRYMDDHIRKKIYNHIYIGMSGLALAWKEEGYNYGYLAAQRKDNWASYQKAKGCFERAIHAFEIIKQIGFPKGGGQYPYETDLADTWRNKGFVTSRTQPPDHKEANKCFQNALDCLVGATDRNTRNEDKVMIQALTLNSKGYHTIYFLKELKKEKGFNWEKETEQAIKEFDKAIKYFQDVSDRVTDHKNIACAYYNKGYAHFLLIPDDNQHAKTALECFEKAIEKNSKYADAWLMKGMLIYKESKNTDGYEEAVTCLDEAIRCFNANENKNENVASSWCIKGIILHILERHEEAVACFDEAMKYGASALQPEVRTYNLARALSCYGKGLCLASLGRYDKAIECFDNFEKIKNTSGKHELTNIELYLIRGQCKYNSADYEGACADFDEIPNHNKNLDSLKDYYLGLYYYQQDSYKMAEKKYNEAISIMRENKFNSNLVHALYNLAVLYNSWHKKDEAIEKFDECSKIKVPEHGREAVIRAKAKVALKKLRDSERSRMHDWYTWWFGHGKPRTAFGLALIAALIVIASPFLLMILIIIDPAYIHGDMNSIKDDTSMIDQTAMTGLTITVGIIVAMLLLPNLKTFKLGPVEMETVSRPVNAEKNVELQTVSALIVPIHHMPVYSTQLQEFGMTLKFHSLIQTDIMFLIEAQYLSMPYTPFEITWS
jgi:tetratricopeptide (TPR) repeat protein